MIKTRHALSPSLLMTPGIMALAEESKCYWLLDVVASYIHKIKQLPDESNLKWMSFWTLTVKENGSATITCVEDSGIPPFIKQEFGYTDFLSYGETSPFKMYLQWDGTHYTLMLPSEY